MADKLVSLVVRQHRYRDILDLRWLKQQGAGFKIEWVNGKIRDYRIENYSCSEKYLPRKKPKPIPIDSIKHGKLQTLSVKQFLR
ncbi:MAG: hypothetical protein B6247_17880 [Candidatus Parabeggiatoa sp. nov. 2]|nr:MAG: hypothetical protein B6247_17880 [Beggiatoa sp. 4572_84]